MSVPQTPKRAKLVISALLSNKGLMAEIVSALEDAFGPADLISPWFDFNFTDYYSPEMGSPLYRRMVTFEKLIEQEALSEIKCRTNSIERSYSLSEKRQVNLDPGYLLYERFVLASGKNYSHRIYIGREIYADLTLVYQKGDYQPLAWTYPDYADPTMRGFLLKVRKKYAVDLTLDLTQRGKPQ